MNLSLSKLILETPNAFVGGVMPPERANLGQESFEQRALFRRKLLVEPVDQFGGRRFPVAGRPGTNSFRF
jgi:hypothetical protein